MSRGDEPSAQQPLSSAVTTGDWSDLTMPPLLQKLRPSSSHTRAATAWAEAAKLVGKSWGSLVCTEHSRSTTE